MTHNIVQKLVFLSIFAGAVVAFLRSDRTAGVYTEVAGGTADTPAVMSTSAVDAPSTPTHVAVIHVSGR